MARFEDLPNEVLRLLPLGLEDGLSIVLVNRRMCKLYSPLLYRKAKIDGYKPGRVDHLACFVRTIASTLCLASAAKELYLKEWTREMSRTATIHIDQSLVPHPRETGRSSYRRGLSLCSKMKSPPSWFLTCYTVELEYGNRFVSIADALTPSLTRVRLYKPIRKRDFKIPVGEFVRFPTLPNLSMLKVPFHTGPSENEQSLQPLLTPRSSKIYQLAICLDAVSNSEFFAVMAYPKTLTKLGLYRNLSANYTTSQERRVHFDEIIKAIVPFKESLELRSIGAGRSRDCGCDDNADCVGSLYEYTNLKTLRINLDLLFPCNLQPVTVFRLCQRMPSGLKKVVLNIDSLAQPVNHQFWFEVVVELAYRTLQPNLAEIDLVFMSRRYHATCMLCAWTAILCVHCDYKRGTICCQCHRSDWVEKMWDVCNAASIKLTGDWRENFTPHPLDHAPSFTIKDMAGNQESEEDEDWDQMCYRYGADISKR